MAATALETDALAARLDRAAELARGHAQVEAFEARADRKQDRVLALLDGKVANSTVSTSSGIGLHVQSGGGTAYVHTVELSERRIREILERGVALARANGRRAWRNHPLRADKPVERTYRLGVRGAPETADTEDLLALLRRAESGAKEADERLRVASAFGSLTRHVLYTDSAGSWCERDSLTATVRVTATLREGTRLGDGMARVAGERGVGDFEHDGGPERIGRDAARHAQEALVAESFPAGRYRVLCDNHLTGMLAHESFGHLTEHDLVSSGWSTLAGRRGERLARETVSISDAPLVEHDPAQGVRVPFDDQGVQGRKVTMLDQGVLRAWMHTRDSAAAEGDDATGNGRALDSRFPAIVRMRNTFFEPGDASLDEALEELRDGIYLLGARGGAPYSDGSFMFTSLRGYRVENGEVTAPVRSTSIHGNVLDFLQNVELLTRDFEVHTNYFGGCGKRDQSFLHVGVGGPHVLVDGALLGGQGA